MLKSMLHIDSIYIKFIFFLTKITIFLYKKILLKYMCVYIYIYIKELEWNRLRLPLHV